jgi:hypothetical protein
MTFHWKELPMIGLGLERLMTDMIMQLGHEFRL